LSETTTTSGIYYTISGTKANEGCVIEKSRVGTHYKRCLDDKAWYVV